LALHKPDMILEGSAMLVAENQELTEHATFEGDT
jgi:hypothetical protein